MPIMAITAMATTEVSQVHEEEHPVTQRTLGVNSDLKMIFNSFFERRDRDPARLTPGAFPISPISPQGFPTSAPPPRKDHPHIN